jgi:hypothetical protein
LSSGVEVHPIGRQPKIGADAAGDVIDCQFTDTADGANRFAYGLVQILEGSCRESRLYQRIGRLLKDAAGNAALVSMTPAVRQLRKRGCSYDSR